jgi:hypothetical protein
MKLSQINPPKAGKPFFNPEGSGWPLCSDKQGEFKIR